MAVRRLGLLAQEVEEVAAGLHVFRDNLTSRTKAVVTAVIGELFSVSASLRRLDRVYSDPRNDLSCYRIRDDLDIVLRSLERTLHDAGEMFTRSRNRPYQMVWEDLDHRMSDEEGIGMRDRLVCYKIFLEALIEVVAGFQPPRLRERRQALLDLLGGQERRVLRSPPRLRPRIDAPGPSIGLPRPRAPTRNAFATPTSPTASLDDSDISPRRPMAPDPPSPLSPPFSSDSSQSLFSSHTSYSEPVRNLSRTVHWAQDIFDGENPTTMFPPASQSTEPSLCLDTPDPAIPRRLASKGYIDVLELPFDSGRLHVKLCWRPDKNRACILLTSQNGDGRNTYCCHSLNGLKIFRHRSTLQLCLPKREGGYRLWARLNFVLFERMCLFYGTFVAMKYQDSPNVTDRSLLDELELAQDEQEKIIFRGTIRVDNLLHTLRLCQDRGTGVVRLEACAARGSMEHVPLWTAFVTKYTHDRDHFQHESGGLVTAAAFRPPPYVFHASFQPPRNGHGEYLLHFTTRDGAVSFVQHWTRLSRAA